MRRPLIARGCDSLTSVITLYKNREGFSNVKTFIEVDPRHFIKEGSMEQSSIKNANGKIVGIVSFSENKIEINNYTKPVLVLEDKELVSCIYAQNLSVVPLLFNNYTLTIGEIAALFRKKYCWMNRYLKNPTLNLGPQKAGRRNSSYGKSFGSERRQHIRDAVRGRSAPPPYERTPEIKARISQTLKKRYASGEIMVNREGLAQAWVDGKYDNAPMGRGFFGYMYSRKMGHDVYFRSSLELNFLLLIEEDERVQEYEVEPFRIPFDGHTYTPDVLINKQWLLEFKPKKHLLYTSKEKFETKIKAALKYCQERGFIFRVFYDTDIGHKTKEFLRDLGSSPEIIEKYNIRFLKEDWKKWLI